MALTITLNEKNIVGNQRMNQATIAFDSSYPTGGESLTPANLGVRRIIQVQAQPNSGYVFEYDYTNEKLLAYYADNDAVADSALIQVADTTDLSGLTSVKVTAIGR